MKVYISTDIEGIAGITAVDEAMPDKPDYAKYRELMNQHVIAACEGAVEAGATEILVKDAHAHGRNLDPERLPTSARVIRGWSGHPLMMVQDLDASFDALAMVGYHSRAGSGANPLAHTMSGRSIAFLSLNDIPASEFHLHAWAGMQMGVPTVFVSGDEGLCVDVEAHCPAIHTCPVQRSDGESTTGLHPSVAEARIRKGMQVALESDPDACRLEMPSSFRLEVQYLHAKRAYGKSFYPGARLEDDRVVVFETDDYFEIMRAMKFLI